MCVLWVCCTRYGPPGEKCIIQETLNDMAVKTRHMYNAAPALGQHRRWRATIDPARRPCRVFAGMFIEKCGYVI